MGTGKFFGLVLFLLLAAGCSGSDGVAAANNSGGGLAGAATSQPLGEAPPSTVEEACRSGAQQVTARLETFVGSLGDISPQDFLAQEKIKGLAGFQNDVAQIIAEIANQNSTLCDLDGLQALVDEELAQLDNQSLLSSYLVSTIRFGGTRERSDVLAGPDDDLDAILGLLDNGSSITLTAGTYAFDTSLLIQRDLTIVGDDVASTIIQSTAADAAIAVFGEGKLTLRDLTVQHVGESSSSVILAFGAPIDIEDVMVSGGRGDEDTGGGNGILLSDGVVNEDGTTGDRPAEVAPVGASRIVNSGVTGNAIGGITVAGGLTPTIIGNNIAENGACGLCFVGEAGGLTQSNSVVRNEFGIQLSEESNPRVTENVVAENTAVGIVLLGTTTAQIDNNEVRQNGEVGIAIQGEAAPRLDNNEISDQTVGISMIDSATPTITASTITATEVGIQVAGSAMPTALANVLVDTGSVGIVHREQSGGSFIDTVMTGEQTVGVLVEGEAKPEIKGLSVENAEVSVSYREMGAGQLLNSMFVDPQIAVQLEDHASPLIEGNDILRPAAAGIVIRSDGNVVIRSNTIVDAGLGIGSAGEAKGLLEGNTITGGETAVSIIENASSSLVDNVLNGQTVAIQVGDSAAPSIEGNEISNATAAAIVSRDEATGRIVGNTILNPLAVGIQIVDSSTPEVTDNVLMADLASADIGPAENTSEVDSGGDSEGDSEADSGGDSEGENTSQEQATDGSDFGDSTVGILFADATSGAAMRNQIFGFVIGVQVGDSANPELVDNVVDGGAANGVGFLYRDTGTGTATGNRTAGHSIGFQISDEADPELTQNVVEQVGDVAFLIQGTATPTLDDNSCPIGVPGVGVLEQGAPIVGRNRCEAVAG